MKVTLLGSGDAIGMPAPMCGCEYCEKSDKRRRSGLLIETEETTIVLDISPDIKEQLSHKQVYDVDAFFVTHFHYDHFWGIQELNHVALKDGDHAFNPEEFDYNGWHNREIKIYGNKTTEEHWKEYHNHGRVKESGNIDFNRMDKDEKVEIGGLEIRSFGIEHGKDGTTQGYVVEKDEKKIVYAPDSRQLEESEAYQNADIFFAEGQLFKMEGHADQKVLKEQLENADPDRIVLLSVTEHLNQMHTEELEEEAEKQGYKIWSDFTSTEI